MSTREVEPAGDTILRDLVQGIGNWEAQISKSEIMRTGHREGQVMTHGWAGVQVEFLLLGKPNSVFKGFQLIK